MEWDHPVPPPKDMSRTAANATLSRADAIKAMWDADDGRPLLVLRECKLCEGSDGALLSRSIKNDKTLLLTKWFRTVKLPAHVSHNSHPFYNVFAGYNFGKTMPHFFLLAHKDAKPVAFSGMQTQSQLWKAMFKVLDQRYAKSAKRAVKKWLLLLDRYDTINQRQTDYQEQLFAVRATDGPRSSKAKKISAKLADLNKELAAIQAAERKVRDLRLLPPPKKLKQTTER